LRIVLGPQPALEIGVVADAGPHGQAHVVDAVDGDHRGQPVFEGGGARRQQPAEAGTPTARSSCQ
jgi:hypothetical protein